MKSRYFKIVLAVVLACTTLSGLVGCKKSSKNNETDALVIASEELDGVFNPFFATSGNDIDVLDYMYIGLLDSDDEGNMISGDQYATIASDHVSKVHGTAPADGKTPTDKSEYFTTYEFLLKNNLKFSDGSPLTIDDVLFTFYVYLDPVYTGATTMYSTNIRGLTKYRTQDELGDAEGFNELMRKNGLARITTLRDYCNNQAKTADPGQYGLREDITMVHGLFKEELESDWVYAQTLVGDEEYTEYGLTQAWQIFLSLENYITIDRINKRVEWKGWQPGESRYENTAKDKNTLINMIYDDFTGEDSTSGFKSFKENLYNIITYFATATTALDAFTADEISKYYKTHEFTYDEIEGIKALKGQTTFNGRTLSEPHDVLKITVNGVDPKAIYNFSVGIAPRKYYTTQALINDTKFGVDFAEYNSFMKDIIKNVRVPVGAGPYMASDKNHNDNVTNVNNFRQDGVVYLKRNDNFVLGPAKIKYINLQERNANAVLGALTNTEIYYGKVPVTSDNINSANKQKKKLAYDTSLTQGYGYIGVSAYYVPDINVRRAIMSAMNVALCEDYYGKDFVQLIHRGISKTNWAYPKDATAYYPFDTTAGYTKIKKFLQDGGYGLEGGKMVKFGKQLSLTFTIAGTGDHPMLTTFFHAQEILNSLGCDIKVRQDKNALIQVANGELAVWAAAWGSTIDPDMYQVYHKNSTANSVKSWGYPHLLANGSPDELNILDDLSELIEKGRTILSDDEDGKKERRRIYSDALDLVMELAIELPTYQRNDMFVYNKNIINSSSLTSPTPFKSPISEIWNVSFK